MLRALLALVLAACADRPAAPPVPLDDVPIADGFDWPVGPPDATGYHDAQGFGGDHEHLGEDWNRDSGGDSDLGDPVHAIAVGRVVEVDEHGGGWGTVVRVVHRVRDGRQLREVESLYAHLVTVAVRPGDDVARGQVIGALGTAGGVYRAHLHLEVRAAPGLPLGGGYGAPAGHVAPSAFIRAHRPAPRRAQSVKSAITGA